MADVHSDISPTRLSQANLVDALYDIIASIAGICTKLDSDAGVPLTTYLANCYTAIFNVIVEDSGGNRTGLRSSDENCHVITPIGISYQSLHGAIYDITNSIETLTEQLDTDVLTDSNYESLCFTALMTQKVANMKGTQIGNGTSWYWKPYGAWDDKEIVEFLYNAYNVIETLTEKLDLDGTVTDTNYEALWFTATCTLKVENAAGSQVGN